MAVYFFRHENQHDALIQSARLLVTDPIITQPSTDTLQWSKNERDGVSNHQPHDCLLNHLFSRKSKKISKLRVTGLCAGNSLATGEFPAQRASSAVDVSLYWRHHVSVGHCVYACQFGLDEWQDCDEIRLLLNGMSAPTIDHALKTSVKTVRVTIASNLHRLIFVNQKMAYVTNRLQKDEMWQRLLLGDCIARYREDWPRSERPLISARPGRAWAPWGPKKRPTLCWLNVQMHSIQRQCCILTKFTLVIKSTCDSFSNADLFLFNEQIYLRRRRVNPNLIFNFSLCQFRHLSHKTVSLISIQFTGND